MVVNYVIHTNGLHGFNQITMDNLWPKSLSSFRNWFGAVVCKCLGYDEYLEPLLPSVIFNSMITLRIIISYNMYKLPMA